MKIAILAGETSGDNYGGLLAENLKKIAPHTRIIGTGGEKMEKASDIFVNMPQGKMGFSDVLKNIKPFYTAYKKVMEVVDRQQPSLVVFIDNPGFNMKLAKNLGKKYTCLYYIPPKIWAHGYGRIEVIRKYIKAVIPVFPFEKDVYIKEKVPCHWFGHPVADLIQPPADTRQNSITGNKNIPVIGILPGSREEEVRYLLPEFINLAKEIRKEREVGFLLSASDKKIKKIEEFILKRSEITFMEIAENLYQTIHKSHMLLAASGTVNLEAAFMEKPLIVFYKTSVLNYILAKMTVQLKDISPVNLIQRKRIVPEYIQAFPLKDIKTDVLDILDKGSLYKKQVDSFRLLRQNAGGKEISKKVAKLVLSYAS